MANFAAKMQRTASASASLGNINAPASGMRRARIYFIVFGSEGSPADVANLLQIQRTTAAGTGTGVTPVALDQADAAAVTVCAENHTIEPTYTASTVVLDVSLNQKATAFWQAPPYGEIVVPATASNGYGYRTPTAGTTVAITATTHFTEL